VVFRLRTASFFVEDAARAGGQIVNPLERQLRDALDEFDEFAPTMRHAEIGE